MHAQRGDPAGARRFADADGRRWSVVEDLFPRDLWTTADEDTNRSGYPVGWLRFTCDDLHKRLRLFPTGWRSLTEAQLERLCRRALCDEAGRAIPPA